jgi:hypothetical protein
MISRQRNVKPSAPQTTCTNTERIQSFEQYEKLDQQMEGE